MAPPQSSALANNSQGLTKVLDDATLNIALETVESLGDPKKIAVEVITQIMKAAPIPTSANEWKLTEDDFNILRTEHLKNKELDKTIAESYRVNLERNNKVKELEVQISELKIELAEREVKEKSRVKDSLVNNCKDREKEEEAEDEECDCEHLCLCDNENDCMTASGYWYNDECNECPGEETSAGEFNCLIPAGAKHVVTDTADYWEIGDTLFGRGKTVGPHQRWHDKEKTKKESFVCRDAEGRIQGLCIGWYEDGTLKDELYYKDDKVEGVRRQWYKDGKLRSENNYKDGKMEGVCRKFHKRSEILWIECNYKDNKKNGAYKQWHNNGTLMIEGNYKDDKEDGLFKQWRKDGTLRSECIYENGREIECK
jgi:hypothetical protein